MRRLLLVRHASTDAVRRAAFPVDEPLDAGGLAAAAALRGRLGRGAVLTSAAVRARATADALGLGEPTVDSGLAECDFGIWSGRSLAEVCEADPEGSTAWMTDPDAAPHGGESQRALIERVREWLERQAPLDGRAIAVTHGGVIKAAVVAALGAPVDAFWRIDATPLRVTELHAHDGRWTVSRLNAEVLP